jgi:hypothetical protein
MMKPKEVIKKIFEEDPDGITFLPTQNFDLTMSGFNYQKKSKYEISNAGHHLYHIMIYKSDKYGNIYHPDNFVAVLTDPYVYVSHLVQCGFFGLVVKKTKSSTRFVNDVYKKVMNSLNEKG